MILLVTHGHPTIVKYEDPHLGRLVQPRHFSSIKKTAEAGFKWAADNDAFNGWDDDAASAYVKMLKAIEDLPGCLFVALPDVVGDARATADRFNEWLPSLRDRGLPVALVAQDGIEELGVPWDKIDCLFIGGTTQFKLGTIAAGLAYQAKYYDKWVHMGRVNSLKRIRYAASIGCDSIDGTQYSRFIHAYLNTGLNDVKAGRQGRLDSGADIFDGRATGYGYPRMHAIDCDLDEDCSC